MVMFVFGGVPLVETIICLFGISGLQSCLVTSQVLGQHRENWHGFVAVQVDVLAVVNLPPRSRTPPSGNQGLIAGLIKSY